MDDANEVLPLSFSYQQILCEITRVTGSGVIHT